MVRHEANATIFPSGENRVKDTPFNWKKGFVSPLLMSKILAVLS
jgi:hypothetical protein